MIPGIRDRHPNVIMIVLDTARADAFEPWGAPVGATPTMAQLATSGTVAPSVIAPSSWTVPSHVGLLSGMLPREFGIGRLAPSTPAGHRHTVRTRGSRMIPTVLQSSGFSTVGLSTNLWISPENGFDTGFDEFRAVRTTRRASPAAETAAGRARWRMEVLRAKADDGAAEVETELAAHMAKRHDTPFFWFINLVECHSPYLPPRPYGDLGLIERWRSADDVRSHQSFEAFCAASLGGFDVAADELDRMRHQYGQAISLLDDWLARLFDRLDQAGILDDTLVVVTSDHGENLGEGNLMGHAFSLDHRLIHVPLAAFGPGAESFSNVRSLTEVPRTLASAIGLERHPWRELPLSVPGVAVSQLDPPARRDDPAAMEAITALGVDPDYAFPLMTSEISAAVEGRWKLVRTGDTDQLFDLVDDPLEMSPIPAAERPDDAPTESLRRAIDRADTLALPYDADHGIAEEELSDDVAEQMRLLGYL